MKFTITMECPCGQKHVGQAEHLVEALEALTVSTGGGDRHEQVLGQELRDLGHRAAGVTMGIEGFHGIGVILMNQEEPDADPS